MKLDADMTLALAAVLSEPLLRMLERPDAFPGAVAAACAALDSAIERLTPFVPPPVLEHMITRPAAGRLTGTYLSGSMVLADLSGFRALATRLALSGRRGEEEASILINSIFAGLLDVIVAHGGYLLRFGGDSLSAFFDATRLGGTHGEHACAAALAMQAHMQAQSPRATSVGAVALHLRVAIHSGTLFAAELGDAEHVEFVITGHGLQRAAVGLEGATAGDLLVSNEAAQQLDMLDVTAHGNGFLRLRGLRSTPPRAPSVVPSWRPGPADEGGLAERIQRIRLLQPYLPSGLPLSALPTLVRGGEFRPLTVLFAEFYAFRKLLALLELPALIQADHSIVYQVLNTFYIWTQSTVQRYGGSINGVDMASYGNRLMIVFGAPRAYEDSAQRAVEAALALREHLSTINAEILALVSSWITVHPEQRMLRRLAAEPLRQRAGIAGGVVLAGVLGTAQRCEYALMGEAVRLASRLIDAANDGDMLLTSFVQRSVAQRLELLPLPALTSVGSPRPVPIFQLLRRRSQASIPGQARHIAPLVGRHEEIARVQRLAAAALAAEPGADRVVALLGEPGVGKSRLLDHVLGRLAEQLPSARQISVGCEAYEQTTPYMLARQLVSRLLDLGSEELRAAAATRIEAALRSYLPDAGAVTALLNPLLSEPLADSAVTAALTPEQRQQQLYALIVDLFLAASQRAPLLIAIDDYQWADASSQALVEALAAAGASAPLLLVLTARQPVVPLPLLDAVPSQAMIDVQPLAPEQSTRLAQALLGGELPPDLRELVASARGLPLFLEETLRYLVESGALQRSESGNWLLARPLDRLRVPLQIEQLLLARLDLLDAPTRALAQLIAVFDQPVDQALLSHGGDAAETRAALTQLVDAALLIAEQGNQQPRYRFAHALIRDVTYNTLLFARRRELHARAAEALSQEHSEVLDEMHAVLAQHHYQAEQWQAALHQYLAAAERAQRQYAHSEALAFYQQALAAGELAASAGAHFDLTQRATILERSGDILALTGDYDSARARYEQLHKLLEAGGVVGLKLSVLARKIGNTYEHQGKHEPALRWLTQADAALASLAEPDPALEQAQTWSDIGWVHFRRGDLAAAQRYLEQALDRVTPLGNYAAQVHILNRLGGLAYTHGDLLRAQGYVEQGLAASRQRGDLVGQAQALNNLSILAESQGLLDESIEYGRQALVIHEQVGNRRDIALTANNLGWTYYNSERYAQAQGYFEQAIEQAAAVRDVYHQMRALLGLGRVLAALERWSAARHAILRNHELALQLNLPAEQLEGYIVLAEMALAQGKLLDAEGEYQHSLSLVVDQESEEFGRLQRLQARLALARADTAQARALLESNIALFERLQNQPEAEHSRRLLSATASPY